MTKSKLKKKTDARTIVEVADDIGKTQNPTIPIAGTNIDYDTTLVMAVTIAAWVIIWYQTGLLEMSRLNPSAMFIFGAFIVYCILNVFTSGTTAGGVVYELNILLTVEQMISILFGTFVLFLIFFRKVIASESCKPILFRTSVSIILVLTLASMWLNLVSSGRAFRALRKGKQGMYNISLGLFLVICIVMVKRGNVCD